MLKLVRNRWIRISVTVLRTASIVIGILTFLAILLSFTDYPFWALYRLGTHDIDVQGQPNLIVVMGGGGMPSADGLLRCYKAAEVAEHNPNAKIVIAIPGDTALKDNSPELLMAAELKLRGVDTSRFLFETNGSNTYNQVMNIQSMFSSETVDTLVILVVTSPEHMMRTVKVFRKTGFANVGGNPAFETDISEKLLEKQSKLDGTQPPGGMTLRYNMWNYLKYEITVLREYCALLYYKLRGWI